MKRIIVLCFCIAMLLFILPADAETFWKMHWKPGENIISFTPEEDAQITAVIEEATQESEGTNIRIGADRESDVETAYNNFLRVMYSFGYTPTYRLNNLQKCT